MARRKKTDEVYWTRISVDGRKDRSRIVKFLDRAKIPKRERSYLGVAESHGSPSYIMTLTPAEIKRMSDLADREGFWMDWDVDRSVNLGPTGPYGEWVL